MNCNIISSNEINRNFWNLYLSKNELSIYHHIDYLNAVCNGKWSVLVYKKDRFIPLYIKRKWGISYISMPPFTQKFSTNMFEEYEWEEIIQFLKKKYWRIDIRIHHLNSKIGSSIEKKNYKLDTSISYEMVFQNYNSLLKKNLLKSKDLLFTKFNSYENIRIFMKRNELFKELVLKKYQKEFENLIQISNSEIKIQYYTATNALNHEIVAVCITFIYKEVEYLLFPYTTIIGKSSQAMSFLIDKIIQNKESKKVDFEGSSIESIARFYKQFGAEEEVYYEIRI